VIVVTVCCGLLQQSLRRAEKEDKKPVVVRVRRGLKACGAAVGGRLTASSPVAAVW
jgi:hypothetical protein